MKLARKHGPYIAILRIQNLMKIKGVILDMNTADFEGSFPVLKRQEREANH
jgi:hypothetical protein